MLELLKTQLNKYKIELCGAISLKNCNVLRPNKLVRCGFDEDFEKLNAVIFAVPYYTECENKNLSAYAVCRDYHIFFDMLFKDILPKLEESFDGFRFCGFADNSPIDEIDAAARSGLGIVGYNNLLITEKYSSYVFLGEIITDMPIETHSFPKRYCEKCGRCKSACPMTKTGFCLSELTQKKGALSELEKDALIDGGSVWGCDKCQTVCPYTEKAIRSGTVYTDIDFFKTELLPILTLDSLQNMSDADFSERAYSWRGKNTVKRNLELLKF